MHEIELRFHIPAGQVAEVEQALWADAPPEVVDLAAVYLDSPDRRLARAGIGLRLRKEGPRWVQTCKGPAEDGMTRLEHNAVLDPEAPAEVELARHAGHPLGERIATALADAALVPTFRTHIQRHHAQRPVNGAVIELALDQGHLLAGQGPALCEQAVHELELELIQGEPGALLGYAHALVQTLPLSLDLRSKAERGERLAQGQPQSPPAEAGALPSLDHLPAEAALRARLLNAWDAVARNASQIGCGESQAEHGRLLCEGLRRLLSALRNFQRRSPRFSHPALEAFQGHLTLWLDRLNAARITDPHDARKAAAHVRNPQAQQCLIEGLGWLTWLKQAPPAALPAGALLPFATPPAG